MTKTVMGKTQLKSNLGNLYTFSQLRLFRYDSQQIKRKQAQAWRDDSAPVVAHNCSSRVRGIRHPLLASVGTGHLGPTDKYM